ncbi:uncharacterized, partial [Tachysurus ichikawai]
GGQKQHLDHRGQEFSTTDSDPDDRQDSSPNGNNASCTRA